MNTKAYPIGVMPRWLHNEKRLSEVRDAIQRYAEATLPIPVEWLEEYNDLCKSVLERQMERTGEPND